MAALPDKLPLSPLLRQFLEVQHRRNAAMPIGSVETHPEDRVFAEFSILQEIPPVILDANTLFNDVRYAARKGKQTALLTGANVGAFRLFVAQHVIDEIYEHGDRLAALKGGEPERFFQAWEEMYLPLIRRVDDWEVLLDLLTPQERQRIDMLRSRDPDDVPSACLSLVLGGFYFSEDRYALEAVYGSDADFELHHQWVDILKVGGDSFALDNLQQSTATVAAVTSVITWEGIKWIASKTHPLVVAGVLAFAVALLRKLPPEKRESTVQMGGHVLNMIAEVVKQANMTSNLFASFCPVTPSLSSLGEILGSRIALKRACLYSLARERASSRSAK